MMKRRRLLRYGRSTVDGKGYGRLRYIDSLGIDRGERRDGGGAGCGLHHVEAQYARGTVDRGIR